MRETPRVPSGLTAALDEVERFAVEWAEAMGVPGMALAVVGRAGLLRAAALGVEDLTSRQPATPDTLFEIGSLSKGLTSTAVLRLWEEGALELDAPVKQYLPWFEVPGGHPPITVHHLMSHTAGIIRGSELGPHGLYEAWALRDTATSGAPGEHFWYSNLGYKILGFLLEAVTGASLAQVMRSYVLDPLEMDDTHPTITVETRRVAATGYAGLYDDRADHPEHPLVPAAWAECATADGSVASTARDMARYLRMLLNRGCTPRGRLLSEKSFRLLTLDGSETEASGYGYGLAVYSLGRRTYVGHGGGTMGYRSAVVADIAAGFGVVFLLNRTGDTEVVVEAAKYAVSVAGAAARGEDAPSLPALSSPQVGSVGESSRPGAADFTGVPAIWKAYVGRYSAWNPGFPHFQVVVRRGALTLLMPGADTDVLVPVGDHVFRVGADAASPERLRFAAIVDGRALRADYSGCPYYRTVGP